MEYSPKDVQTRRAGENKEIEEEIVKASNHNLPSSSSSINASPSHEFSFTISLQTTPPPCSLTPTVNTTNTSTDNNASTCSAKSNLSQRGRISLGGEILPIQSVSNTNMLPRNSNSSAENFTLALDQIESDFGQRYYDTTNTCNKSNCSTKMTKFKSISNLFKLGNRRKKAEETKPKDDNSKTKMRRLDISQVLKKFVSMVTEQLFPYYNKRRERERRDLQKRPHSFSLHYSASRERETRERWTKKKKRGQRSAPASIRASPSNSGHFSASSINKLSSSSDESTMEELQNAIQAAIAHCKSSIAAKGI